MGFHIRRLPDAVEAFVESYWNTDVCEDGSSALARRSLQDRRIYDAVRRFLLDVIQRDAVTVGEWGDLCNIQVDSLGDVRADAEEFWDWLFDEEPLPSSGNQRGPIGPPQ